MPQFTVLPLLLVDAPLLCLRKLCVQISVLFLLCLCNLANACMLIHHMQDCRIYVLLRPEIFSWSLLENTLAERVATGSLY